jgi:cobalt-zinc-cadmium efflux system outer membrane protein
MIIATTLLLLQVSASADSLTLAGALAQARANRSQAAIASARVAESRASVRVAGTIPNPSVSYSYSDAVPTNHLIFDQPLDWLLRRGSDRSSARAGVDRALADSAQTMILLDRDVRVAFWRARAGQLSLDLVEQQALQADSLARIAVARFRAGDISQLEQEQAALEAARARQSVSTARETALVARAELARAIGAEALPLPVGALDAGLDRLPDSAVVVSAFPAVRAAVADSTAAAASARSTALARVPLPAVTGGVEWGDPSQPGTLALVGVSIPLPLWQNGGGAIAGARAKAAGAAAATREARLDAARDVRQSRIRLEEAAARARVARDSLMPAAARLRARALRAYQSGETGIVPVLDAFRGERDIVIGGLQDQLAFQEAAAEWYALTGHYQ